MRRINNSIYIYTETLLYILYNLGDDGDDPSPNFEDKCQARVQRNSHWIPILDPIDCKSSFLFFPEEEGRQ